MLKRKRSCSVRLFPLILLYHTSSPTNLLRRPECSSSENTTRETGLLRLLSFTVVVIANGYDLYSDYSLFLADKILSFVVPCNLWHICSNECIIFCRDVRSLLHIRLNQSLTHSGCLSVPKIFEYESTRNKVFPNLIYR